MQAADTTDWTKFLFRLQKELRLGNIGRQSIKICMVILGEKSKDSLHKLSKSGCQSS